MPHDKVDEETAECPMALDDIDLFEPGAQKFWYESYEILHKLVLVVLTLLFIRYPAKGTTKDTDGWVT